jgi:uncharacterized protein
MSNRLTDLCRNALVAWVGGISGAAMAVSVASLAATVLIAVYVAGNFSINTNTDDILSAELPFRKNTIALKQAFPQLTDNIVIVIDGQTADLADDAAVTIGTELRKQPKLFGNVFDPVAHPFFRRNGLLFLDTDELYDLSDRLAEAQPFLGVLWQDPSLRGLFAMLERAIDFVIEGGEEAVPIEIGGVLGAISEVIEAQREGRFAQLSWQKLMIGDDGENGPNRRFVVVEPPLDYSSLLPAGPALRGVRQIVADLGLTPENGLRVRLTGSVAMAHDELKSVEAGMGYAGLLSLSLVVVLLLAGFKSFRLAAATFVTLIMGLIWTAGFAVLAVGEFNLISVAFAVLFIGLSVDFGIHFGLRYREAVDGGSAHADALRESARNLGGALMLCAVAAAIAFFSFLPTDYRGLAELGLIAGAGMLIALFSNFTVLPALLSLFPPARRQAAQPAATGSAAFGDMIGRQARIILWAAMAIGIAAAVLLPQSRFDFDPLNLRDPATESVSTYFDLIKEDASGPYSATVLAENIHEANMLIELLNELNEVKGSKALSSFLPEDQDEKLEIIGSMALFLEPAFATAGNREPPSPTEIRTAVEGLLETLRRLAESNRGGASAAAAASLHTILQNLGGSAIDDAALIDLQNRLVSSLPKRLDQLRNSLQAGPVEIDDIPAMIASREVAPSGAARIKVYPRENLTDRDALRRFVTAVQKVAPGATGGPVIILEAGDVVVRAFREAAILSILAIGALLLLVLRNVRDSILVFAPLVLATLLTVAFSVLFSVPFNFANIIVLPLLFGLGVANGIHVVLRARDMGQGRVFATSTPRAVVFSALTTIGSFGSMALSSHPGTSSMGILLAVSIALTLISTLVLLPALMALWGGRSDRAG